MLQTGRTQAVRIRTVIKLDVPSKFSSEGYQLVNLSDTSPLIGLVNKNLRIHFYRTQH